MKNILIKKFINKSDNKDKTLFAIIFELMILIIFSALAILIMLSHIS